MVYATTLILSQIVMQQKLIFKCFSPTLFIYLELKIVTYTLSRISNSTKNSDYSITSKSQHHENLYLKLDRKSTMRIFSAITILSRQRENKDIMNTNSKISAYIQYWKYFYYKNVLYNVDLIFYDRIIYVLLSLITYVLYRYH